MKATELSVGDIVLIDGKPTRIDAVHLRKVGWHSRKDRLTWTRIDKVQPMPVTADLLRWNSFREDKLIHGWFRRTFEGAKTVSVCIHEILGKAEFAKAEQNRKIKIEEAKANLEAEKLNAQAEIERAKGAAEAIRIENGSITPAYIQYLWVRQQNANTNI